MLIPRPSSQSRAGSAVTATRRARRAPSARVLALIAALGIAAAACVPPTASNASPTPTLAPTASPSANPYAGVTEGSGKGVKIGYVSYGEIIPYVFQVSEGIRAQAALAGVELVECDAKFNGQNVSGCMKQLSDAGVKGIIQFQGDLADPAAVCNEAPSGVPVVAVEFPQSPCAKTLVSADDYRAGQIAGAAVGAWVKAHWSCSYDAYVSFESTVAAARSQMRMEGYRQAFAAACQQPSPSSTPGPITNEQVGRAIDNEPAARQAMAELLPSLAGKSKIIVVAVNDDAARGALAGAADAGRSADVWVSGQGGDEASRALIRTNDHYLGDAAYFPERFGQTILPAMLDLIAGKSVPSQLLVEPAWIDATNIATVYPQ